MRILVTGATSPSRPPDDPLGFEDAVREAPAA